MTREKRKQKANIYKEAIMITMGNVYLIVFVIKDDYYYFCFDTC